MPTMPRLPARLASAIPKDPFGTLVGKRVFYQDPKGKVRECIVIDQITSHLRGTSYVIADCNFDGWDEEVSEDEMQNMLSNVEQS